MRPWKNKTRKDLPEEKILKTKESALRELIKEIEKEKRHDKKVSYSR